MNNQESVNFAIGGCGRVGQHYLDLILANKHKLQILNGSMMNLEQAVLAFDYAVMNNQGKNKIREAMGLAISD